MKKIRKELKSFALFVRGEENRKTIVTIIIAVALLFLISLAKGMTSGAKYISAGNGTVQGVMREDVDQAVSFPLRIEAEVDGDRKKKDVTLTIEPERKGEDEEDEQEEKSLFEAELSELLLKLSKSTERKIMLPGVLPSGAKLTWRKGKSGSDVLIIFMAPVLIWLLYLDGEKKKRDLRRAKAESVERELPSFNDQLLLLMGSGLIFRDAFRRIAEGYQSKEKNSYFEREIIGIERETEESVSDIVSVITRRSEAMGISQFSRLTGVIRDNQLKGIDISGKLKAEGEILWDLRKRNAEERGRLAETKLTVPLAVLLMVLVLVTAAPAVIQVEGG